MKKIYLIRGNRAAVCLISSFFFLISTLNAQTKTTVVDFSSFSGTGLTENLCNVFGPSTNVNVQVNGVGGYTLPHISTVGTQRYFQSKGTIDLPCAELGASSVESGFAVEYPFKNGYSYTVSITANNDGAGLNVSLWVYIMSTLPHAQQQGETCYAGIPNSNFDPIFSNGQQRAFGKDFLTVTFPAFTASSDINGYLNLISDMLTSATVVPSISVRSIKIVEQAPSSITCSLPAPANASYVVNPDFTTTFNWSPVSNAFQYRINVTDVHNGVTNQQTYYTNTTSLAYCALGSGDNVFYTVQAICDNDMLGTASSRVSFNAPYPTPPAPSYDFSNCNKLDWEPISGAGSYSLQVQDLTAGTPAVTFNTTNYFASVESDLHLTSGHNYQATVSAFGGNGCNYQTASSSPVNFTAVIPYMSAPTGLTYNGTANTLSWNSVPNASNYSIQYIDLTTNSGPLFANVIFTNSVSGNTLSLVSGHSYQAEISAINAGCNNYQSAYSGWYNFTAGPPPPPPPPACLPPTIVHPQALGNKNVQVIFLAPTSGQTPSNYNVKLDNNVTSMVFNNVGTTSPVVVRSNSTGMYTVSMQSICPTGSSSYVSYVSPVNVTSIRSAATATGNALVDTDMDGETFRVYPVPASGQVWLSFQGTEKQKGEIVITNTGGSIVLKKEIGVISGQNTYTLDVSQLASGFYIIRMVTGQSSQLQKLIIQK